MIDGISKLLNVATTPEQTIECHKALVLSQQRMLAFMAEIQRKQRNLLKRDNTEYENLQIISSPIVVFRSPLKARTDQSHCHSLRYPHTVGVDEYERQIR